MLFFKENILTKNGINESSFCTIYMYVTNHNINFQHNRQFFPRKIGQNRQIIAVITLIPGVYRKLLHVNLLRR
jgi:hypothetical protein